MKGYEVGDRVMVSVYGAWERGIVTNKTLHSPTRYIYRIRLTEHQSSSTELLDAGRWYNLAEMKSIEGYCEVCKSEVGIDRGLIKPHGGKDEMCYGSYMPGL